MNNRFGALSLAVGYMVAASLDSMPNGFCHNKKHWKETQTDEDREEKLRKAKEKRDRKAKIKEQR